MCAVAKSLTPFTFPQPLKSWYTQWLEFPPHAKIQARHEDLHKPWKPRSEKAFVPDLWMQYMCFRYDVDETFIEQFILMLHTVKPGNWFYHGFWTRMAQVDYS